MAWQGCGSVVAMLHMPLGLVKLSCKGDVFTVVHVGAVPGKGCSVWGPWYDSTGAVSGGYGWFAVGFAGTVSLAC